jgi:hypothetical protein
MADYFLVHDRIVLEQDLRPCLAAAWRQRNFAPCLALCREWAAAARDYAARYHVSDEDVLLLRVADGLSFDRAFWRTLVGEFLLFAARDMPEFPTRLDTLCYLLAGVSALAGAGKRSDLPPIHQALAGSRDLAFGAALYRPEHAGYNNAADVSRLASYLAGIRPECWSTDLLAGVPGLDEDDRADELDFAREWFAVLRNLYTRAAEADQVVVLERIF